MISHKNAREFYFPGILTAKNDSSISEKVKILAI